MKSLSPAHPTFGKLTHTLRPLRPLRAEFNAPQIQQVVRSALHAVLRSHHWHPVLHALRDLRCAAETAMPAPAHQAALLDQDTPTLPILDARLLHGIEGLVRALIPWRIGPFQLGELLIDAEWRSYLKWRRIEPLLPPLSPTARIADIGCSNGYFLYRLLARDPQLVVGFDPVQRCWLQHSLLQLLLRQERVAFIPAGLTSLAAFPRFFDLLLCCGVLYHQRDPFSAVRQLYEATQPGGTVLVESLTVDTPGPFLLVPAQRYAKMRNAWTIPSPDALAALMERAGFTRVTVHRFGPLSLEEQRRTPYAPYESLAEFLDPLDRTRTIEGYPAPHTAVVTGVR